MNVTQAAARIYQAFWSHPIATSLAVSVTAYFFSCQIGLITAAATLSYGTFKYISFCRRIHFWCEKAVGTIEYEQRLQAIQEIRMHYFYGPHLSLANRGLTSIPRALEELTHLKSLNLSGNQFVQFPKPVLKLIQLESLGLGKNSIEKIPNQLKNLKNLQKLGLGLNQISILPDAIGELPQLEYLGLGSNQITQIPKSLSQLFHLKIVDISRNQIQKIPYVLAKLPRSCVIYAMENPILPRNALVFLIWIYYVKSKNGAQGPEFCASLRSLSGTTAA